MKLEIRICGAGGQGIGVAGIILGKAAIYSGFEATQVQSYGSEPRGGASLSEIVISDKKIIYQRVLKPDVLLALSQNAFDRFFEDTDENTLIVVNSDLVKQYHGKKVFKIKALTLAEKKVVSNIVAVGFLSQLLDIFPKENLERAVINTVPKRFLEVNLKALRRGIEEGKKVEKEVGG